MKMQLNEAKSILNHLSWRKYESEFYYYSYLQYFSNMYRKETGHKIYFKNNLIVKVPPNFLENRQHIVFFCLTIFSIQLQCSNLSSEMISFNLIGYSKNEVLRQSKKKITYTN